MNRANKITAGVSVWNKIRYHILYGVCRLVGYLPKWFLYYVLAEILYFLLYYIARYRVKVTRSNLRNSFPEKSREELRRIERRFYRHLSEIFIDTIDLTGISRRELRRRMVMVNEEEHRRYVEGRDWIAGLAHYGSWEYFMVYALGDEAGRETVGVYKTLHSKPMDMLYLRMRSRMNMTPVAMPLSLRHVVRNRDKGVRMCLGLIADQSPGWTYWDKWYDFLGQPTHFYDGMETIARKFGMPVYFMHIEKTRRAHYRGRFECLYDGSEPIEEGEITQRYAYALEKMIRERPELWLWSHKRWKHMPSPEELELLKARNVPDGGSHT